jgi:hypothetical protein
MFVNAPIMLPLGRSDIFYWPCTLEQVEVCTDAGGEDRGIVPSGVEMLNGQL